MATHPFPSTRRRIRQASGPISRARRRRARFTSKAPSDARAAHRSSLQHERAGSQRFADARSFVKAMLGSKTFRSHNAVAIDDLDKPIAEALAETMGPAHHQAGSDRMGPVGDRNAVVGPICASAASTICASPTPASIPITSCTTLISPPSWSGKWRRASSTRRSASTRGAASSDRRVKVSYEGWALSLCRLTIWSRATASTMTAPVTKVLQVASMPKKMIPLLIT